MKKLRTAQDIFTDCPYDDSDRVRKTFSANELRWCIETAQREAIEAASENAKVDCDIQPSGRLVYIVDKQSILNLLP